MRSHNQVRSFDRPRHHEIRHAISELDPGGFGEVREALHGGFESFEHKMNRRMKTRRPELRPAYKVLRDAGEMKVREHLAAVDMEGLAPRRQRSRRAPIDRSRLARNRATRLTSTRERTPA